MDLYKYIKTPTPGLGIYLVTDRGKKYIRVQFGQPSNISSKFKGTKVRLFPVTDAGLKEATKFYNTLKPFVIAPLSRSAAAIAGAEGGVSKFLNEKKTFTKDLVDFIKKYRSDPKYNIRGGVNKLFNDALKFFKKDSKYSTVPEGYVKGTAQSMEFLKGGDTFQLPRKYDMIENFRTPSDYSRHNKFIKSLIATQLLEKNPNFVNIRNMATKFYTTDVDRKTLLKENPALVKATSGFLGKNNIRADTPAGEYLRNKGFDFNKKLYKVLQFRSLEEKLGDMLEGNLSKAERAKITKALFQVSRNRGTVFKKLKAEFPNLTKGQAMILEHATPQGLINTGSIYPKSFLLKAQYAPAAFNSLKNQHFDKDLIKLIYQYNNEFDPEIKQSLEAEIKTLRKNFNDMTKVKGKGYLDGIDFKFGEKVKLIDKTPTLDLLTDEGSIRQFTKNAAHSNAYLANLGQKSHVISEGGKRYTAAKLTLDIPTTKSLNDFIQTIKESPARVLKTTAISTGCINKAEGGRVGFALGTGTIKCIENKIRNQPLESTQKIVAGIEEGATGVLGKIRNMGQGFLGALGRFGPKVGKYGAIAAAGALAQPLVKQFRNDDTSTWLTDEHQQAGMLEALIEGERPKPRSEILDWGMGAGQLGTTAAAIPGSGKLYDYRRGLLQRKTPKAGPITEAGLTAGDYLSKHAGKGYGKLRAGAGVGMKALSGMFTPAGLLATEPFRIAQKRREGESWGDIATSPMTWMGPAFAPSMTRIATAGMKKGSLLPKLLRLGISSSRLAAMGPVGWAGLVASLGWEGRKQYEDYKRRRGFFASEDRLQT
jgi:hypothetical protein